MTNKPDTFSLDESTSEAISKIADEQFEGNRSMALRWLVTEYTYMTRRFIALGRSITQTEPTEQQADDALGAGGG